MIVEITEQGLQITNLSTKFCKISSQWRNYFEWPASLERFLIIAIFVTTSDDTEYERAFAALEEIKLPRLKTFFKENCLRVIFMIYTNCFSQKCQPCACVCVCVCVCACVCGCTQQQTIHGKVSPGLPPPSLVPSLVSVVIVDLTPYYLHESYVTFEVVLVNEAYEDVLNNNGFRLMCFTQTHI